MDDQPSSRHDPYAALRIRDFRRYVSGSFLTHAGFHMQTVAVGWEVYERTSSALALGMVGLVQVVPVLSLALLAGHVADRFNRKHIMMVSLLVIASASASLAVVSTLHAPVALMYACLFVTGVGRAFIQPARASLLPQLVPRKTFTNAVTWGTTGFQLAAVIGPAVGGVLIAIFRRPAIIYIYDASAAVAFCLLLARVHYVRQIGQNDRLSLESLAAGVRFVLSNKVVLGAITLDMFAVLLGGAVALLPIYAKDILKVGPTGLGWMQAAPAIGALCMSFIQSHRPPHARAGRALLLSIVGFGVTTIIFGLSRSFPLSLGMLFLTGAFDNISVIVRHTLVQLLTPDAMRGRVSAINGMFISISNELGGFESGMIAAMFGPIIAVVSGGVGTLAVVAIAAWRLPELRRFGRIDTHAVPAEEEPSELTVP